MGAKSNVYTHKKKKKKKNPPNQTHLFQKIEYPFKTTTPTGTNSYIQQLELKSQRL